MKKSLEHRNKLSIALKGRKPVWTGTGIIHKDQICSICKIIFRRPIVQKHCSLKCVPREGKSINRISPPWNKGLKTGLIPKSAFKKGDVRLIGNNNPSWKGGITPINHKIRTSTDYAKWRKAVFNRDNYACVNCGDSKGGNLEADHIKPFAYYPELRLVVSNGQTLCKNCHRNTPTWGERVKNYATTSIR